MKHALIWSGAIKVLQLYLFKYINKGPDRILVVIVPSKTIGEGNIDEIKQ